MAIGFAATMLLLPVTAIGQDKALGKNLNGATSSPSPVLRYQESQQKESQQIQI